ncbi:MAG: DNA polymerase III subunit alpha [Treponemataceae bacterium]|nr:MAG: DNA polymerase III subunit alpha [Treponemataceae bacterium]
MSLMGQGFVHLHVHTDYSLLDSMAKIPQLVSRAKELGMTSLAITDHGNMFGVLHFANECKKQGIKPIIGCEFYVAEGSRHEQKGTEQGNRYYHLILLAKNTTGYKNLVKLCSFGYTEGFYYKPRIDAELLERYHEGIICLSACLAGELPQLLLAGGAEAKAKSEAFVQRYKTLFGDENFFIELQDHGLVDQKKVNPLLIDLAKRTGTPLVATNDVHYINQEDWEAHEILLCVGRQKKFDSNYLTYEKKEFYLKSAQEVALLFPSYPEAISNTEKIAASCSDDVIPFFGTKDLKDCLPVYDIPPNFSDEAAYLRHMVNDGLQNRYGTVTAETQKRAEYELDIIINMGFTGYFLIVWDFIHWAKEQDIPIGPGRGSGAGSIVAYAIGITNVDPLRFNLLFERFLNPERISMPDFDIDICTDRRQEVIEYTRQKYGDPQVGHIATFGTLKAKAVIKDVGRALNIPLANVNAITKLVPGDPKTHLLDAFEIVLDDEGQPKIKGSGLLAHLRNDLSLIGTSTVSHKKFFDLCFKLEDTKRNSGLHASGIVIGKTELSDWVPIFTQKDKATKIEKTATQFTMDIVESCGLVKMDYLGLKTLTLIKHAEDLIKKRSGHEQFSTETIDETDKKTYDIFCSGNTSAAFQFESPGMRKVLRQAKPNKIEDLTALNAIFRPGPMQHIPQFIDGKFNANKIQYPDPCLKEILEETYGVMIYQEQVMQVAQRIAGYSLGQADMLRRVMGKKKEKEMIAEKQKFCAGAVKNGFDEKHADRIFEIMEPFAGYGFNKSHAAAYSVLAYRTMYLKANFPAEFIAASLANVISNPEKMHEHIEEGKALGVEILPPNVNKSGLTFNVADGKVVFGFLGIKGVGAAAAEEIIEKRKTGDYTSFLDFLERVDSRTVNKRTLESLTKTGCFDSFEQNRATLLANIEKAVAYADSKKSAGGEISLFEASGEKEFSDFVFETRDEFSQHDKLADEKELIGLYVSGHPLDEWREIIKEKGTVTTKTAKFFAEEPRTVITKDGSERQIYGRKDVPNHTIIGILRNLTKRTKSNGKEWAQAEIEDIEGTIDVMFWAKIWEKINRDELELSDETEKFKIVALIGKIHEDTFSSGKKTDSDEEEDEEASEPKYQFIVEGIADLENLKKKQISELHIKIKDDNFGDAQVSPLREMLFSEPGACSVFFHLDTPSGSTIIRASNSLKISSEETFIQKIKDNDLVEEVWKS